MNRSVGEEFIEAKEKFGNRNFRVYNSTSSNIGKIIQKEQNKKNKKSKDNMFIKKRKRPPVLDSLKGLKKVVALKNKLLKTLDKNMFLMIGGIMLAAGALLAASKGGFGENEGQIGYNGRYDESDPKNGKINKIKNKIITEAERQGVDPALALAVASYESGFRQEAKSYSGAVGIFQIMPSTAKGIKINGKTGINPYDEDDNIRGGVAYLKNCLNSTHSVKDALVMYNVGPGNLSRAKKKGIDPDSITNKRKLNGRTIGYAEGVTQQYNKYKQDLEKLSTSEFAPILKEGYNGKYYNPNIKTKEGMGTFNNKPITSTFGNRIHPIFRTKKFHPGIDVAYTTNEPVYAFFPGRVIFHGEEGGYGKLVKIKDANNYIHYYGHLNKFRSSYPSQVKEGELIGYAGSTGYATGSHLHYEIRRPDGTPIDPRTYFLDVLSQQQSNKKQSKSRPPLNKNTQKMKNNINQTNTKQVTTSQNTAKQTPNNIRTQKTSNINTGNNRMVTGSKLPSHKATQQNTGKKKGL